MRKIAFDLRVGDVVNMFGHQLRIESIKGLAGYPTGLCLRMEFSGLSIMKVGYYPLYREFEVVGHV